MKRKVIMSFYLDATMLDRLERIAESKSISASAVVRLAVDSFIMVQDIEKPNKHKPIDVAPKSAPELKPETAQEKTAREFNEMQQHITKHLKYVKGD